MKDYTKRGPFYCERIEDAVQWPIFDDDRAEIIKRHRDREYFCTFIEKSC